MTLPLLMNMGFAGSDSGAPTGPANRMMLMGIGSHFWWLLAVVTLGNPTWKL